MRNFLRWSSSLTPLRPTRLASVLPSRPVPTATLYNTVESNEDQSLRADAQSRVSHLLKAIFNNDTATATRMLGSYVTKSKLKRPVTGSVYLLCLVVLLAKLNADKANAAIGPFETKSLVDDYFKFKEWSEPDGKDLEISKTCERHIVDLLRNVGEGIAKSSIRRKFQTYADIRLKQLQCDSENQKDCLSISENSIVPIRSADLVSFERLCKYIEDTRFGDGSTPVYEVYQNLSSSQKPDFLSKYLEHNRLRQLYIEEHCLTLYEDVGERSDRALQDMGKFTLAHKNLLVNWFDGVLAVLQGHSATIAQGKARSGDAAILGKFEFYFDVIPKKLLVNMLITELMSQLLTSEEGHMSLLRLCQDLGRKFKHIVSRTTRLQEVRNGLLRFFTDTEATEYFGCLLGIVVRSCRIPKGTLHQDAYIESLQLLDEFEAVDATFLVDTDNSYPAFVWGLHHDPEDPPFKKTGIIKIHPYLVDQFKEFSLAFFTREMLFPMMVPPQKWCSPFDGGFLTNIKPMVNHRFALVAQQYFDSAHSTGQLNSVYKSLDALGSTAWTVNSRVMRFLELVVSREEGFLLIPPKRTPMPHIPPPPRKEDFGSTELYQKAHYKHRLKAREITAEFHSLQQQRIVFDLGYRLIRALGHNGDIFFLPHLVDFRGRAYPLASLFSHYGEDHLRALMMFWDAKPLGSRGFDWIKYHLAGVYGNDKLPFADRVAFIDEHLDEIRQSARDPLATSWWKSAEKPWQVLSLCFEVDDILSHIENGNDVTQFRSRIPIHQDGSCNGLQHYAALGLDEAGGTAVNLVPGPRNDVYSVVLDLVKTRVAADMIGTTDTHRALAAMVAPILNRKLIKQTVMTSVYGVTAYGAKLQIRERIKDFIRHNEVTEQFRSTQDAMAQYVSSQVLDSLKLLFSGAKAIEDWLVENCRRITKSYDWASVSKMKKTDFFDIKPYQPMMWTSMSGFPVIQLYKHVKQVNQATSLQRVVIDRPHASAAVNLRKQLNAVAPNFIHSLDATHMQMTAVAAHNARLVFAAVHDSFWTHACDVDALATITRETFVLLHTSGVIELVREDLQYTARNKYQLVWATDDDSLFAQELKLTRKNDLSTSDSLFKELENPEIAVELYKRHRPLVYFGNSWAKPYANPSGERRLLSKKFIPLLVPVHILECPRKGTLDIHKVLQSEYFFS